MLYITLDNYSLENENIYTLKNVELWQQWLQKDNVSDLI